MALTQDELIDSFDGNVTPEQMAQLLALGEGDTDDKSETGGTPNASAVQEDGASDESNEAANGTTESAGSEKGTQQDVDGLELTADNAEILAKDGIHRIPYSKLLDAREGERQWKAVAEENQRQLETLLAKAQERADAGIAPTQTDVLATQAAVAIEEGADISIFGDFSEEGMAQGVDRRIDQKNARLEARLAELEAMVAPIKAKEATAVHDTHYNAIYEAHPDADSIAESTEFAQWRDSQASFMRPAIDLVFKEGATKDVIELFSRFKAETGSSQPATPSPSTVKDKAQEVISKAATTPPASLSDFPGGRAAGLSKADAMADMDGIQLLGAMDTMTNDQVEAFLNSI